jgi:hypothetical protein
MSKPYKCFISHSYQDSKAVSLLIKNIPSHFNPFIFPPITVSPNEFVSNALIESILDQDGLIYLKGGYSAKSFWVAFERDYSKRSGKGVSFFDPPKLEFKLDLEKPANIYIYPSYARQDADHIRKITGFMSRERFFNVWLDSAVIVNFERTLELSINRIIDMGGYFVLFWSDAASKSSFISKEIEFVCQINQNRILIALLEDISPPSWIGKNHPPWLQPVKLFGDATHSEMHCWDDLIVRIYWLVYNNNGLI